MCLGCLLRRHMDLFIACVHVTVFAGQLYGCFCLLLFLWCWQKLINALMTVVVSEAARCQRPAADSAELLGWMCHSFCVCPSPERKVLIGPSYGGSKFRAVFWCELAAQPLRMKHHRMCHLSSRPSVTALSTPLSIKPKTAFVSRNPVKNISLP